jgi:hypothetical protein
MSQDKCKKCPNCKKLALERDEYDCPKCGGGECWTCQLCWSSFEMLKNDKVGEEL